jgi:sialic acid synthase SpsE
MFRSVLVLACAVAVAHAQSVQSACKSIAVAPTAGSCKGVKLLTMTCVPSTMTADSYASLVMSLCAACVIEIRNRWTDHLVYFCS